MDISMITIKIIIDHMSFYQGYLTTLFMPRGLHFCKHRVSSTDYIKV
nr:MAG TPA: hypothetical protein [Caudoviricetes sp.]